MAPRPPEPFDAFLRRVHARSGPVRFGTPHATHVLLDAAHGVAVRRLMLDPAKAAAFLAAHGRFMPEDAEDLADPGPDVLLEGPLTEVLASLQATWPVLP